MHCIILGRTFKSHHLNSYRFTYIYFADSRNNNDENENYREPFPNVATLVKRKIAKSCSVDGLKKALPITDWLPKYQTSYFLQDFVAGLSVGLTAIPQGIAYAGRIWNDVVAVVRFINWLFAVVAGLPPQYGLYSSFMGKLNSNFVVWNQFNRIITSRTGCFVYAIFGSCKDITIGPTAIMSLMIHSAVVNLNVDFAILGTFLSGCVIFMLGFLNLGLIESIKFQ